MTASLSVTTTTAAPKGSVRWMAIELLEVDLSGEQSFGKPATHTKMTDVWSYGMVVYVCGRIFDEVSNTDFQP